jgi:hypothetical protein
MPPDETQAPQAPPAPETQHPGLIDAGNMPDLGKPGTPTDRPKMVINEEAVTAAALAMTQAHHGPDETDTGGYLSLARSIVAALGGMEAAKTPPMVPDETPLLEPLSEDGPAQVAA